MASNEIKEIIKKEGYNFQKRVLRFIFILTSLVSVRGGGLFCSILFFMVLML